MCSKDFTRYLNPFPLPPNSSLHWGQTGTLSFLSLPMLGIRHTYQELREGSGKSLPGCPTSCVVSPSVSCPGTRWYNTAGHHPCSPLADWLRHCTAPVHSQWNLKWVRSKVILLESHYRESTDIIAIENNTLNNILLEQPSYTISEQENSPRAK